MKFVSFHTHTTYSYADGFGTVREHVRRVADLGMSSLALSEHGNVNSHAALERESREAGIKPIYGIEAYFGGVGESRKQRKYHITLFAMNDEGYQNLNRLVTQAYKDFYYYPTVSPQSLRKHSAGIAAFSGCSDSLISCSLLGGKALGDKRPYFTEDQYNDARLKVEKFQDIFDDRFYLEVQRFPGLERTCILNPTFARLSEDTGVPLIATADVHYPYPEQNKMQAVLHSSRRQQTIAVTESEWEYNILLTYPLNDQEIIDDLIGTGLSREDSEAAVWASESLAADCNVSLPKAKPLRFHVPGSVDYTARQYLWVKLREGWQARCDQRPELRDKAWEYNIRLKQEMKVIGNKDFCDYFLVVADLVKWAKDADITVGPGRGSAAGSLVCYLLGITEIDPMYDVFSRMVFERFIDPTRNDMPDIDLDFDDELRHLVPERAREIYGSENVCNVANHNKYRGKMALNGVARAYSRPQKIFDAIGKRCATRTETDERQDDSIQDVIDSYADNPEIQACLELRNPEGDRLVDLAVALEGNQHSMGKHAGGFVISSEPIPDVCSIREDNNAQVIPYEKRDAEYIGLLKVDFLGLTTMGMLGLCRKWTDMDLNSLYGLFYCNSAHEAILKMFREDDCDGIFQYEGGTTRQVVRDVSPNNFDELAACNALSRPGPLYGGQTSEYVKVKRGEKDWDRIGKGFDEHVEWTYGQIVYQEQIMWILRDLAGFDTAQVLRARKIIGKKLGEHQFTLLWEAFRSGCATNNVTDRDALRVWGAITTAAGYAFNTSHAYSYALIAWWQAWFKLNYPAEFYAASLAKNGDGKDNLPRRTALLQDAERHSVTTIPWDVSIVEANWRVDGPAAIMPGLRQIPAIGEKTADVMVEHMRVGDSNLYSKWSQLAAIKGIGPNTIAKMMNFCNQDDPFGVHRTERQLDIFRKQCAAGEFAHAGGFPSISEFAKSKTLPQNNNYVAFVGIADNLVYKDEVESIRNRTGQSVDEIKAGLDDPDKTKKATLFAYDEFGEVALRVSRWCFVPLQERLATVKKGHHIVVAYGRSFEDRPNSVQVTNMWVLEPE